MGKLNHRSIDNGDVKIPTSGVPVESKYESFPDPDITSIKSIDDDEINHLLKFFRLEHDEDIFDIDLQILQA